MTVRIRKSHGGKFLVSHRSVHYHDIMSNTVLQKDVARSGNMYVRHSFKHFLNVKMASYALPSFRPLSGKHIGKDCIQPDMSCHSGIVRELDEGLTPEMYLNMSALACTDGVRFVKGGQFYYVNLNDGNLLRDDSFTRKQYPFGIYYGWFKVRVWTTSKDYKKEYNQSGYMYEKFVKGFLLQKRTAKFLCGRVVWIDEITSRKRTNNTYSREVEYPSETAYFVGEELKQGSFRRCACKNFVPANPLFYIPFEAYDALPFIDAFIPVNFRNPVCAGMKLPPALELSYVKNVKWISTAPGATSSSGNVFMEDPTERLFEYTMVRIPTEKEWVRLVTPKNIEDHKKNLALKAFAKFLSQHISHTGSRGTLKFKYIDLKKWLAENKVTLQEMTNRLLITQLKDALVQGMTQYTNDMIIYETTQLTPRDKKEFFSEQKYTETPLYLNNQQVKSIIKSDTETIKKPIRIVTSTTTYTTVVNKYDFSSGEFISRTETHETQVRPVSTLLLGGKEVFKEMAMTPTIRAGFTMTLASSTVKSLIKTYNTYASGNGLPQLSQYIFNPIEVIRSIMYDAENKRDRKLRIDTKDPKGDTIPVTMDSMVIGFSLPKSLQDSESEGDAYYFALINSSGKCVFLDSVTSFVGASILMTNEILTSFLESKVKVPASTLTGYDAEDVDTNGNITFSLAPGLLTNVLVQILYALLGIYNVAIPVTTYTLSSLIKYRDMYVKEHKGEAWVLSDTQRDKYVHYLENGYLPIDNFMFGLINWNVGSGFQKGVYDMNVMHFDNKLTEYTLGNGKKIKVCSMEPETKEVEFYDISSGKDIKYRDLNDSATGYFTQLMMDFINPVTASVLDLEQIPTIIAKFDTPEFVSSGNPANQVHIHLKYGAHPLYQNIGCPLKGVAWC